MFSDITAVCFLCKGEKKKMQSDKQNHNYCNDTVLMCHFYDFMISFFKKKLSVGRFLFKT